MSNHDSEPNSSSESACSIAGQWAKKNLANGPIPFTMPATATLEERVRMVFEQVINPDLARDGGAVEFVGLDSDRVVQIRLKGSCQGCASSAIRLSMILEPTVKTFVPEVRFLEVVL